MTEGSLQALSFLIIFSEGLLSLSILNFGVHPCVPKRQSQTIVLFLLLPYVTGLRVGDYYVESSLPYSCILFWICFPKKIPFETSIPIICSLDCGRNVMSLGRFCSMLPCSAFTIKFFSGKGTCFCLADCAKTSFSS